MLRSLGPPERQLDGRVHRPADHAHLPLGSYAEALAAAASPEALKLHVDPTISS
jgi:hypothetical protein